FIEAHGFRFSRSDHIKLIKLMYLVMVKKDQWHDVVHYAARALEKLIKWSVRKNDGEFRNEVCSVRYENKEELAQPPLFGAMFHFTLDSQVNCPEFLAYFPLVQQ
ncbi:hypothetical protein TELCIR_17622, partial [Teladorsagia circumcincta]